MKNLTLQAITLLIGFLIAVALLFVFLQNRQLITAQASEKGLVKKLTEACELKPPKKTERKRAYRKVTSLLRVPPKQENGDVQLDFAAGRSFFVNPWVIAPSSTNARDGLGPLYNARTCQQCHQGGGRGRAPDDKKPMRNMLMRISVPGENKTKGVIPEPNYGNQIQLIGIRNSSKNVKEKATGEAQITVKYKTISGQYPDGESYTLRKPDFQVNNLAYGPLAKDALLSPRIGPTLAGMGLINEIVETDILALADPEDTNQDGISGRPNLVWSREHQKTMIGRFGLKANTPTLRQQVADAFVNDIGITSHIFPDESCTSTQTACLDAENGQGPNTPYEISNLLLDKVVTFVSHLKVPSAYSDKATTKNSSLHSSQNTSQQNSKEIHKKMGKHDFHALGCASCHHPTFTASKSASFESFKSKKIFPYSDFLLHDMGEGLADGRPDFEASGSEWRTAPLWDLSWRQKQGKFNNYLHDGRAQTVEEAILWHGGEAEATKQKFMHLPKARRRSLLEFIESL